MKKTSPAGHTIRFRRWSRKAYAAFASIGRCVTIGCLRKSVADSSLSKQKIAGNAGHAGCGEESPWKGETKGRETDIGIPPGGSAAPASLLTELRNNEPALFEAHVVSHVNTWEELYVYTLKQENTSRKQKDTREIRSNKGTRKQENKGIKGIKGTDYRESCSPSTSCIAPAIRTSFFIHELNPRMITLQNKKNTILQNKKNTNL